MTPEFKFEIGETVQMVMGRSCMKHFDGKLAVITKRSKTPKGHEIYRMDPIDTNLQQNLQFDVGCIRKLEPEIEPLSEIHTKQISISPEYVPQKVAFLNGKLDHFALKRLAKKILKNLPKNTDPQA